MYATRTLFDKNATYINVDDIDFFKKAIDVARQRFESGDTAINDDTSIDDIKRRTPVLYASKLSKQTKGESESVPRKGVLTGDRARRRFMMIDADFDEGEDELSKNVRNAIIELAHTHSTPLLIYPTVSYPTKPRFRAVMFPKRVLSPDTYYKAMNWWFDHIGYPPMDDTDLRMSANRNAPIFINQEQVDGIYSTLDNDDLNLLDTSLWKDYEAPKKVEPQRFDEYMHSEKRVNSPVFWWHDEDAINAASRMGETGLGASRNSIWKFIESIACAQLEGVISDNIADDMLIALASRSDNESTRNKWVEGNRDMLAKSARDIANGKIALSSIKPLHLYRELAECLQVSTSI